MRKLQHARSFNELVVYQKAAAIAENLFEYSKGFPADERYSLTDQIRRSSSLHFSPRRVARPARCREMWRFRPEGRGVVLDSTSSTPMGANAADCDISRAAVATW
jgi:hypothetical protein